MTTPSIPQRPARASQHPPTAMSNAEQHPQVPPRPTRNFERSQSREREAYARSPLNESPFSAPRQNGGHSPVATRNAGARLARPPSVQSLPLVGQEGIEYASLEEREQQGTNGKPTPGSPTQTSNVASDLPLHAPKASAPGGPASNRLAAVTRTDSARAGASPAKPADYDSDSGRPRSGQFRPSSSVSMDRRASQDLDEHGIPTIGLHVPMYPNAGDVQMPTPGPPSSHGPTSHAHGSHSRPITADGRRRSAAGFHVPPGSYGLHGHGIGPQDQFEKAWYQRHPEELAKEGHSYHAPASSGEKPEWAMSSDELNNLVRNSGRLNPNAGVASDASAPSEAMGYMATEKYSSRSSSPKPLPLHKTKSRSESRTGSVSHAESPLRKASFAEGITGHHSAMESETEDESVHLAPTPRRGSKYGRFGHSTDSLGHFGDEIKEVPEEETTTPILAPDEVAKNPNAEWLHAAVSPETEKHANDGFFSGVDAEGHPIFEPAGRSASRNRSRPGSRPSSIHGAAHLQRFASHDEGAGTPLEEIEEYEPLFGDEDDDKTPMKKPLTAADRLKRPDLEKHRFPSRDIWEDNPDSLSLTTTVDTPEEPGTPESSADTKPSAAFELPERELARQGEVTESERRGFLQDPTTGLAKPKFKPGLQQEVSARPNMRQRFPSQDIWEDSPDSLSLTTTVDEDERPRGVTSPEDGKAQPSIPAAARSNLAAMAPPSIPARPATKPETSPTERKLPAMPDRPKPQVPLRPAKKSQEEVPSVTSPPTEKAKPAVPSSKFASIKAGFMSDLNSRLKLGPQGPPKPELAAEEKELEEDKAPLADARKSRARGPARRKPAASPSGEVSDVSEGAAVTKSSTFSIASPWTVWSLSPVTSAGIMVDPTGGMTSGEKRSAKLQDAATAKLQPVANAPMGAEGAQASSSNASMDARARADEMSKAQQLQGHVERSVGFEGDVPEPVGNAATNAAAAQDASVPAMTAMSSTKEAPAAARKAGLDHVDPAMPKATEAEAEEEREQELQHLMTSGAGVQTGETRIESSMPGQTTERMTAVLGGDAQTEADVIVKDA